MLCLTFVTNTSLQLRLCYNTVYNVSAMLMQYCGSDGEADYLELTYCKACLLECVINTVFHTMTAHQYYYIRDGSSHTREITA